MFINRSYLPMNPQFITVKKTKLAYYEKNQGVAPTLFFIHGNSISAESWLGQLNNTEFSNYRMIALDLPGHGESDASEDPENDYTILGLGIIVAEAIKALTKSNQYIAIACSLGTNILAEALAHQIDPIGIALIGPSIVGDDYQIHEFVKPGTSVNVVFTEEAPADDVRRYAKEVMFNSDEAKSREFVDDYYRVKPHFRSILARSIQQAAYSDEISLLKKMEIPVLVIFGENERIVNPDYLDHPPFELWGQKVFKLAQASHLIHQDQPAAFNSILRGYVDDRFKSIHDVKQT